MRLSQAEAPAGFYVVTTEEIWEGLISPDIMTLEQLDAAIEFGLAEWERMHPDKKTWFDKWLPILVVAAVGGVAIAMVAAPIAAAGVATAATQAAPAAVAAGGLAASQPITAAAAVGMAQKGAMIAKAGGMVYKGVTGKNDADRLIQAADIIQTSPDVTTAATKIFETELAARGQKLETERAKKALQERVRREQELYAEYMRRQAYQLQDEITAGSVPGMLPKDRPAPDWATVAMAATPFVLYFMGQR